MSDLGNACSVQIAEAKAFSGGLQAGLMEKMMRRIACLLFEQSAKIIVIEGQRAQIVVELEGFIRIIPDNGALNLFHNRASRRRVKI